MSWRWGLNQNQTVKKDRSKSVNKSGKFRKVRFLDSSQGTESGAAGGVVNDKEQKRVWFSRLWFSIRRKQNKRKSSADNNGINPVVTPSTLVDIQCKFLFLFNFRKNICIVAICIINSPNHAVSIILIYALITSKHLCQLTRSLETLFKTFKKFVTQSLF